MANKVLIVDDAAFMRMMIKDILEKNGYDVIGEASNGLVAVDLYKKEKPDVVTMDITMPDMDGIEAVKQIRAFDPNAKIIMCSAMGQQEIVIKPLGNTLSSLKEYIGATILGNGLVTLILDVGALI